MLRYSHRVGGIDCGIQQSFLKNSRLQSKFLCCCHREDGGEINKLSFKNAAVLAGFFLRNVAEEKDKKRQCIGSW